MCAAAIGQFSREQLTELFRCPISGRRMVKIQVDPCGHTFDETSIALWLEREACCPLSRRALTDNDLTPSHVIREAIDLFAKLSSTPSGSQIEKIEQGARQISNRQEQDRQEGIPSRMEETPQFIKDAFKSFGEGCLESSWGK